jgi:hypothetical protein
MPSGFDSLATFSDPGEPGGKPKELIRIKVGFRPGTRIDTAALPRCRASDTDVRILGLRACPAPPRLGIVHAEGAYFPRRRCGVRKVDSLEIARVLGRHTLYAPNGHTSALGDAP